MKNFSLVLHMCIALCSVTTLAGQQFPCNGELLLGTSNGVTTTISRPVFAPFTTPFLSPLSRYQNGSFDALGFNSRDNYIYGVQDGTNDIVRLKSDNTFEKVGTVSVIDTLRSNAGDCTPQGLYLCHDYGLNQILVFDVVDGFELLDRIDLFWDPSSPNSGAFTTRIFDFAIDPNNPTVAISYQGTADHPDLAPDTTRGYSLLINLDFNDPNLGMVTPLEAIDENRVTHLDALIFSPQSGLSGYGTGTEGLRPVQNTFFAINPFGGDASQVLIKNPGAVFSDGCSCPFSFSFSNEVPTEGVFCNNDQRTFVLKINNNAYNSVDGVTLRDTFPEGMVIEEISDTYVGSVATGSGVGTRMLEISGLMIPPKSVVESRIKVNTIDDKVGPTYNQAFLEDLPPRFNGDMGSDDLGTVGSIGDASCFFVEARDLEDVSWQVTSPTDCIDATDGEIEVSSPQFFPGQEFEIRLRNKIGWEEETFIVVADANNSFSVDSLIPGDYQIFSIRSLSEDCGLAVKDTTILLEAPNAALGLLVSNNGPICEGEALQLDAELSVDGDIRWTGPSAFASEDFNPMIKNAMPSSAGNYKVVAKYGFCEQIRTFNIDVKPEVNVTITGKSEYCARDVLELDVTGVGDNLEYSWTGPDGLSLVDSTIRIRDMGMDQAGYYQVTTSNGACSDTAGMEVILLPSPTLSLDRVVLADFCTPIVLAPQIIGDSDVSYQWSPQEGLSCADCSNPQVQPLVQSRYYLKVENDYQCSDSSSVRMALKKEDLVYAPNVFLRSSTSGNDRFSIYKGCTVHYIHSLNVYDKWSNVMYNTAASSPDDALGSWDGLFKGKRAMAGVYLWIAKVELVDGTIQYISGDVTLL